MCFKLINTGSSVKYTPWDSFGVNESISQEACLWPKKKKHFYSTIAKAIKRPIGNSVISGYNHIESAINYKI